VIYDRRSFLKTGLAATAALTASQLGATEEAAPDSSGQGPAETQQPHAACLVDTTLCIGCRTCEEACNRRNELPRPLRPFSDRTVLRERRRPDAAAYTVVNGFTGSPSPDQTQRLDTYVKMQCMHCLDPACESACIVGALIKGPDGAVIYNSTICIGCRYCLVACPFDAPAYEYDIALAPRVSKCTFCASAENGNLAAPSCAAACPTEALVFGRREDLLALARARLAQKPVRYIDRIYGEHEIGGTSWLYLTGRPIVEAGLLPLPERSSVRMTETIQHGIYRFGAIPLALYGLLSIFMWTNHRRELAADVAAMSSAERGQEGGHE
jgi:formate dehydrogenase iron-sulfur subunit